jgi:hypothetical protein
LTHTIDGHDAHGSPAAAKSPRTTTDALKAGVHLKIMSVRLGHASEAFTASVYQHALPGIDREAAGRIAALFLDDVSAEAS